MKTGFAGEWCTTWICVSDRTLRYTPSDADDFQNMEELNLKKVTNVTLVKDVKNLQNATRGPLGAPNPAPRLYRKRTIQTRFIKQP